MMFISNSSDISSQCKDYSHQAACYHRYRICDPYMSSRPPRTLQLCRGDCQLLRSDVCPREYQLAEKHELIGPGKLLPDCGDLRHKQQCIPILEGETDQQNPLHFCYVGNGKSYRGAETRTEHGRSCLQWSEAQGQYSAAGGVEDLKGARNYCRNPGGRRPKPWCYAAPNGQEQYCDIPICPPAVFPHLRKLEGSPVSNLDNANAIAGSGTGDLDSGQSNVGNSPPLGDGHGNFWQSMAPHWKYTILGGAGAGALLLLLLLVYLCCRCCRKSSNGRDKQSAANGSLARYGYRGGASKLNGTPVGSHHMGAPMELSSLLPPPPPPARTPPPPFASDAPPEIGADRLRFVEPLGQGQFGQVWKGELIGYGTEDEPMQVLLLITIF